ncbi:serine O-acetyltransferase [Paraburkholderia sp. J41]|uniref:serine O-acetyltransferase n=1 Tax=Paraburkholderia sp. J41 TaxID=2805433 RepID=UPI002AC36D97|nr:DapH/DapD/GlmU-related protein [Paraburkholderia sp. J41]
MLYFYRISRFFYLLHIPFVPWVLKVVNRILFSVSVPPSAKVGRNVIFGYQGLGIVVHRHAVIGNNVIISPNVVIGGRSGKAGAPLIEDDVLIGAGASVLGPIRIGRGAKIGANAVVLADVPAGSIAVGVPARICKPNE